MDLNFLSFLKDPTFVTIWYGAGIFGALWLLYDVLYVNTHVSTALKPGWIILSPFVSFILFLVYLWSARPPKIEAKEGEAAAQWHHEWVNATWKRVIGSVIHCVGGDGLGIITAMVIMRSLRVSFWTEFWVEYAAGYAFGWFIFQYIAMRSMTDSGRKALWMAFRAEFLSMITVMLGMGLVMACVTPTVVGKRPLPDTYAFWGFAALGLLVGAIFTCPMNWWMVAIGWKHGMK